MYVYTGQWGNWVLDWLSITHIHRAMAQHHPPPSHHIHTQGNGSASPTYIGQWLSITHPHHLHTQGNGSASPTPTTYTHRAMAQHHPPPPHTHTGQWLSITHPHHIHTQGNGSASPTPTTYTHRAMAQHHPPPPHTHTGQWLSITHPHHMTKGPAYRHPSITEMHIDKRTFGGGDSSVVRAPDS